MVGHFHHFNDFQYYAKKCLLTSTASQTSSAISVNWLWNEYDSQRHCNVLNQFWLFKYLIKHTEVLVFLWNNLLERLQFTTFKTRKYICCNSIWFLKVSKTHQIIMIQLQYIMHSNRSCRRYWVLWINPSKNAISEGRKQRLKFNSIQFKIHI